MGNVCECICQQDGICGDNEMMIESTKNSILKKKINYYESGSDEIKGLINKSSNRQRFNSGNRNVLAVDNRISMSIYTGGNSINIPNNNDYEESNGDNYNENNCIDYNNGYNFMNYNHQNFSKNVNYENFFNENTKTYNEVNEGIDNQEIHNFYTTINDFDFTYNNQASLYNDKNINNNINMHQQQINNDIPSVINYDFNHENLDEINSGIKNNSKNEIGYFEIPQYQYKKDELSIQHTNSVISSDYQKLNIISRKNSIYSKSFKKL